MQPACFFSGLYFDSYHGVCPVFIILPRVVDIQVVDLSDGLS